MNTRTPSAPNEKGVSTNNIDTRSQRMRLRMFGLSVATYAVAILATFLITRLGIGDLSLAQWATLIWLSLFGISLFFVLFYTRTNLLFSEPSLTREQIVYSSIYGFLTMYWLPEARPIILFFLLPPFSFGVLSLNFRQYLVVVACMMGLYAALLSLEYLQDRQGFEIQYQFFLFVLFGILLTWFAAFGGFVSNIRQRLRTQKAEIKKAHEKIKIEMTERKRSQIEKDHLIVELKEALRKIKTLSGFLPICATCKKIRDDKGYWNQIESYIETHSEAEFSHSICPDCAKKFYPDIDIYDKND
jgi:Na+/melibiose symporter-like transporter